MRSSSSKKLLGCLALTLCFAAAPFGMAQGTGSASADTTSGASSNAPAPDAPSAFRRKARLVQSDMQAEGGSSADNADEVTRRARMRKAIMRARQMQAADGAGNSNSPGAPDGSPEPFARGPMAQGEGFGGGGFRKRPGFMQDGQFGGRRGLGRGGGFPGGRKALDLSALNLTEEQKAKIQQLRKGTAMRAREVRRKLFSGGQELRDMMFDPAASDEQIRAKGRELRKLRDQAEDMKLDDFLSIRGVLTAEQRKRLPDVKPGGPRAAMVAPGGARRGDDMPPPGVEPIAPNQ